MTSPPTAEQATAAVDTPGVYTMTAAEYHADPVAGGSLSSTGARLLITACPAVFRHGQLHGRPDRDVFDRGRAAHTVVLGVGDPIRVLPHADRRSRAYRDDAAAARAEGHIPLLAADAATVTDMADALRAHPVAGPLLARPGRAEQVRVWRDPRTGVWCRAMTDWMPDVADDARLIVVDYKTTVCAAPGALGRTVADYGYDQQGDFYTAGVHLLDPRDEPPLFVLLAQEKTAPYLVTVGHLGPSARERGAARNRKALDLYRWCRDLDVWPGYGDAIAEIELPYWAARDHERAWADGAYDTWSDPK